MTIGLVGRKVGMMRIFTDEGDAQPVTVLDVSDNRITQIKTADKDGYAAVQVAFGKRRASRVKKPLAGHLAKAAVEAYMPTIERELAHGTRLSSITRHMLGLFRGMPGARAFRRVLATESVKPGAGVEVLAEALAQVVDSEADLAHIAA